MRTGVKSACDLVGYPVRHGRVFLDVATRMQTVILGRDLGRVCTGLIEENYALKGFRIDTKTCDWGPMAGFACVDPRLNKAGEAKRAFNARMTPEALSGHIPQDYNSSMAVEAEKASWRAFARPIAISDDRVHWLRENNFIEPTRDPVTDDLYGVSNDRGNTVRLPWRLARVEANVYKGIDPGRFWGIFVDPEAQPAFKQNVLTARPFIYSFFARVGPRYTVRRLEAVLGMCNPGTKKLGVKACVTGDYDLFGVWPKHEKRGGGHARPSVAQLGAARAALGSGRRPLRVDDEDFDIRRLAAGKGEHWQLGNTTQRVELIKVMLNSALQATTGFTGGQLVHHSDEAGNPSPSLSKPLAECLPIIAFVPGGDAYGLESLPDLAYFVYDCHQLGYAADLRRPGWIDQLAAVVGA